MSHPSIVPEGCYFYCNKKGNKEVTAWLKEKGLEYEDFYADFILWCGSAVGSWRQGSANDMERKLVEKALQQWPTNATGMIESMEEFLPKLFLTKNSDNMVVDIHSEILEREKEVFKNIFTAEIREEILYDPELFAASVRNPPPLSRSEMKKLIKKEKEAQDARAAEDDGQVALDLDAALAASVSGFAFGAKHETDDEMEEDGAEMKEAGVETEESGAGADQGGDRMEED